MHLAQELLMNVQCGGGSGSLAKETRAWKMKNIVAGHQKLTMTNWELILLRLQDKLPKNSVLTILWLFGIWSKLKKVKKFRKWVHSWADWKSKNVSLSSVIFSYSAQQQIISYILWWATKSGLYMTTRTTSSATGKRSSCKALPKARLAPKRAWSLCGGLLPVWSTAALWVPVKPLHLRTMLSKWWDALKTAMSAASTGQQNGPNSSPCQCPTKRHTNNASKAQQTGLPSFASSAIFTWPLSNWLPLLQASQQHFARKTLLQPAGCRKCFPRVRQIPRHIFLCYRNKHTFFSLAKMCWL